MEQKACRRGAEIGNGEHLLFAGKTAAVRVRREGPGGPVASRSTKRWNECWGLPTSTCPRAAKAGGTTSPPRPHSAPGKSPGSYGTERIKAMGTARRHSQHAEWPTDSPSHEPTSPPPPPAALSRHRHTLLGWEHKGVGCRHRWGYRRGCGAGPRSQAEPPSPSQVRRRPESCAAAACEP